MKFSRSVEMGLSQIQEEYNPNHDVPNDGQPKVTWAELALLEAIVELSEKVGQLEAEIERLQEATE